jgi:hypothetical protein
VAEHPRLILQLVIAGIACVKMCAPRYEIQQDVRDGMAKSYPNRAAKKSSASRLCRPKAAAPRVHGRL